MKLSERNQLLSGSLAQQLFALVNLGLVQSMASGVLTPTEAVERFYHARNCLYVQKWRSQLQTRPRLTNPAASLGLAVRECQTNK